MRVWAACHLLPEGGGGQRFASQDTSARVPVVNDEHILRNGLRVLQGM
jgi:hypothetical protein